MTVLFFIDSDLSWDPKGFVRILESPLEFIGGAYPVKQEGVEHRFHIKTTSTVKEDGRPIIVETSKVAGGFVKITRNVMLRMQEAYPELKVRYRGKDIWMLWDPLIVNGEPWERTLLSARDGRG